MADASNVGGDRSFDHEPNTRQPMVHIGLPRNTSPTTDSRAILRELSRRKFLLSQHQLQIQQLERALAEVAEQNRDTSKQDER